MTRFARAKGSKASNERMPNDATPWHVMKQQLEDNISSKNHTPEPKAKTARQLLKEKDDLFYYDNTGNVNNDWAEFDRPKNPTKSSETPISKKSKKEKTLHNGNAENASDDAEKTPRIKSRKSKNALDTPGAEISKTIEADCEGSQKKTPKRKSEAGTIETTAEFVEIKSNGTPGSKNNKKKLKGTDFDAENNTSVNLNDNLASTPKIKAKKRKSDILPSESAANSEIAELVNITNVEGQVTPKKTSKKRKSDAISAEALVEHSDKVEESEVASEPLKKKKNRRKDKKVDSSEAAIAGDSENKKEAVKTTEEFVKISKRQKRNQKRKNKIAGNEAADQETSIVPKPEATGSGGFNAAGNEWSSNVNFGKQKVGNKLDGSSNGDQSFGGKNFKKPLDGPNGAVKRKAPKIRDDKEHKRRKPAVPSIKCTINGMDVEIVQYDGFPVKKEDAERLRELRKQMILKGIPKSEIDAAMKLERRKAEKALARIRKQVCFNCRKAGHNLSDCPELGAGEAATGICFKCGSTEHTHFECKVQKKQEYGFASCFICREQGHIAKQCPDNPKGLYPQGGSCKICGDVTHLRKDCPDLTKEKEENSMTLGTIAESTLESLDEDQPRKVAIDEGKKAKIVKF